MLKNFTKTKKLFVIIGVFCLIIIGYGIYREYNPIVMRAQADLFIADNLGELKKESDIVVKVKIADKLKEYVEYDEDRTPITGYTLTNAKIEEVISGKVSNENSIIIAEPYYHYKVFAVQNYLMTIENYEPMNTGAEYILFLRDASNIGENTYYIVGNEYGKFPTDNNISDTLNNNKDYQNLQTEVAEQYLE